MNEYNSCFAKSEINATLRYLNSVYLRHNRNDKDILQLLAIWHAKLAVHTHLHTQSLPVAFVGTQKLQTDSLAAVSTSRVLSLPD